MQLTGSVGDDVPATPRSLPLASRSFRPDLSYHFPATAQDARSAGQNTTAKGTNVNAVA